MDIELAKYIGHNAEKVQKIFKMTLARVDLLPNGSFVAINDEFQGIRIFFDTNTKAVSRITIGENYEIS